jgi:hypothetical protein
LCLSRTIVQAINARDFEHCVFDLATPEFYADFLGSCPPTERFSDYISAFRQLVETNPAHHIGAIDISTDGREVDSESANVYVLLEVTGHGHDLVMPCLAALGWRKQEGTWRWVSHIGMRSFGFLDGYSSTGSVKYGSVV